MTMTEIHGAGRSIRRGVLAGWALLFAGMCVAPIDRASADMDEKLSDEQQVVEKKTKVAFPRTIDAAGDVPELTLTGVGVRSKFRFKVYGCAHYVATGVELGADPTATVIDGDFARRIVMHFVRDVGAEKITGAYREGFEKNGYDPEAAELKEDLERFLGYFEQDLVKGDVIELTAIPGQGVVTVVNGAARPAVGGGHFTAGLWAIWFGDEPVSKGMREDLLELVADAE